MLHVLEEVATLTNGDSGNRCGFVYASVSLDEEDGRDSEVTGTRSRIAGFANLVKRHPLASLHIDAHCGTGAPGSIAHAYSLRRAQLVADQAISNGVEHTRITCKGHGK